MAERTVIAVDLAKNLFEVAVSKRPGEVCLRKRLSRKTFLEFFSRLPASTVLLEACSSAHYWARALQTQGHEVILLPPHTVRPYVPRDKTDRTDTKGMLEAHRNADIYPVPIKSLDQQALATLHRLRSSWISQRTARINAVRGSLREYGLVIPLGSHKVVPHVLEYLGDAETAIPDLVRPFLAEACNEIVQLGQRIRSVDQTLKQRAQEDARVRRLCTIPGIGIVTATALVAFVGQVRRFRSGRCFASYLGLTPRERSSGARRWLGRISKRGDAYLRTLLIHGARSLLLSASRTSALDSMRAWALRLKSTRGYNKAVVAVANKMSRFVWAVWHDEREFRPFVTV
jgi:transposase